MDYECELACVVGAGGRDIPVGRARDHIFGFTIFNDFSARDAQAIEMQGGLGPGKGKDFDKANALGPCIVTLDEIVDPYHFREFDHAELAGLCAQYFDEVRVLGLFGSPRYMEIYDEERAKLDRLLAKDPLRLRRLVPIRVKQRLYDAMLHRHRGRPDPRSEAIEVGDFELREDELAAALDVCAVCERPVNLTLSSR